MFEPRRANAPYRNFMREVSDIYQYLKRLIMKETGI
tara:strand:+ start:134 stop:241 length:108 start_codon:yes stop_codon:yes gene_type:complete